MLGDKAVCNDMDSASSDGIWRYIEQHDKEDQRNLLQWQLQARELILSFAEIKPGDHLVHKQCLVEGLGEYEHHFLCIGQLKEDGKIKPIIIHYYNTVTNAIMTFLATFCSKLGSAIKNLGKVQEMTLPDRNFITEKHLQARQVYRVVWPDELRRYSVDEVIRRAKRRKDETWFDLAKNNCETFVMKCLCDLEVSTQVTPAVKNTCEVGRVLVKELRQGLVQGVKAFVDIFDDVFLLTVRGSIRGLAGLGVASFLTVLSEVILACHDISEATEKMDKGVTVKGRRELIKEVKDVVVSGASRSVGSIVGMIVGQLLIPIPAAGGIIGGLVGLLFGHLSSTVLTKLEIEWLNRLIGQLIDRRLKKISEKHQKKP